MKNHISSAMRAVILFSALIAIPSCFALTTIEDRPDAGISTADSDTDTDSDGNTDINTDNDVDMDTGSDVDTDSDTNTDTDSDGDADTDTDSVTDSDVGTDSVVNTDLDGNTDDGTDTQRGTEDDTATETATENDIGSETVEYMNTDTEEEKATEFDTTCEDVNVTFQLHIPTVMLVIDQSSSMTSAFGNTDRWSAVGETLLDPTDGLVKQLEANISFGLEMYAGAASEEEPCPQLSGVAPALNNYETINTSFTGSVPQMQTPTGESLQEVIEILKDDPSEYEKIIVLATDGLPDTCAQPQPDEGQPEALAAAQEAWNQGFPLFIISVGDEIGAEHLDQMANAGQGYPLDEVPGADPYLALEPQALTNAFWDIILSMRACVLTLDTGLFNDQENAYEVAVDGTPLDLNGKSGWRLNRPTEVEILGESCESILNGTISEITVTIPCGTDGTDTSTDTDTTSGNDSAPILDGKVKVLSSINDPRRDFYQISILIANGTNESVAMNELNLHYYYTADGSSATQQTFSCWNWPEPGSCGALVNRFVATSGQQTDTYLNLSYSGDIIIEPGADSGIIDFGFHQTNSAEYDVSNDWSYLFSDDFVENARITLYRNSDTTPIWGEEPGSLADTERQ